MTYITEIDNVLVDKDGPAPYREENWRRTMTGKVQLRCPYCDQWFALGPDFEIDKDGMVSDTVYHCCDEESESQPGWVVLPRLIGWNK